MAYCRLLRAVGQRVAGTRLPRSAVDPRMMSSLTSHGHGKVDEVNSSLKGLLRKGEIKAATQFVRAEMRDKGVAPRSDLLNKLLLELCARKRTEEAATLLSIASTGLERKGDELDGCLSVAFGHVIESCLRQGLVNKALGLFRQAQDLDVLLDMPCCNAVLASLGATGKPELIERVLEYMKDRGLEPTAITYSCGIWSALQLKEYERAWSLATEAEEKNRPLPFEAWVAMKAVSSRVVHGPERVSDDEEAVMEKMLRRSNEFVDKALEVMIERRNEEAELLEEEEGARAHGVLDGLDRGAEDEDFDEDFEEDDDIMYSRSGAGDAHSLKSDYIDYDWGDDDDDEEEDDDEDEDDEDEEEREDEHHPSEAVFGVTMLNFPLFDKEPTVLDLQAMPWGPVPRPGRPLRMLVDPIRYLDTAKAKKVEEREEESDDEGGDGRGLLFLHSEDDDEFMDSFTRAKDSIERDDWLEKGRGLSTFRSLDSDEELEEEEEEERKDGQEAEEEEKSEEDEEGHVRGGMFMLSRNSRGYEAGDMYVMANDIVRPSAGLEAEKGKPPRTGEGRCGFRLPDLTARYDSKRRGSMLFLADVFLPQQREEANESVLSLFSKVLDQLQERSSWR